RPLPVADLSALSRPDAERLAAALAARERARPFDLVRGPLVRACLLRLGRRAGDGAPEHRFFLTQHHIVSDGFSTGLLIRELSLLYPHLAGGGDASAALEALPRLPVQYADYAVWQRRRMAEGEAERQLEHWRRRLVGAPDLLELPVDRPRAPGQGRVGGICRRRLSPALAGAVEAFGRRTEATPFMVLLAAAQLLLGRWCGQEDVVVGTPVAGRDRAETEPLLGFFVNTLVLRTELDRSESFAALVARVRRRTLEDFAHQELPFDRLVEELAPRRSAVHTPLFQVFFALQNAPQPELSAGGLRLEPVMPRAAEAGGTELFELELNLAHERDGGLSVSLRYARRLFDGTTVERLGRRFEVLLASALAAPDTPVARLDSLAPAERHQLVHELVATSGPTSAFRLLTRLAELAARDPGAPAVTVEGGETWSRGELAARSEIFARHLLRLGIGRGARIALGLGRTPQLVAAMLGTWHAGAATVPIDPEQPPERLARILEDALTGEACPVLVVAGAPPAGLVLPGGTRVVDLAEVWAEGEGKTLPYGLPLPPSPEPDDVAYVLFTSGTTGRPKGVVVRHGELEHTLAAAASRFGFGPGDRGAVLAAPFFDIFLFELLSPLAAGGEAVLFTAEQVRAPEVLAAALPRLTRLHAVPALMAQVVAAARAAGLGPGELGHLATLFVGGDRVPPALLAEMRALVGPGVAVEVLYGPTEGTIICAAHSLAVDGRAPGAMIGWPLPGAVLRIVDRWGGEAPLGAPGELVLGGGGVSGGYLGRPGTTAAVFVPGRTGGPGSRAYRTGDRVRRRADGVLEFLGRIDHQLKIRGFRIEAGEVEARLEELASVREAVVLARDDGPGGPRLVAWVATGGLDLETATLRRHLAATLPEYMVPSAFVVLDELPLNANGK
ncbi:MAG: amino acid adenylation domain-containing protein, partial [Acidobacteria bacterium]|nr:amino acid adenylation domain-containing protein [Acidobacteriota bacterium]